MWLHQSELAPRAKGTATSGDPDVATAASPALLQCKRTLEQVFIDDELPELVPIGISMLLGK